MSDLACDPLPKPGTAPRPRPPRRWRTNSPTATLVTDRRPTALSVAILDQGTELPFDLFLGVPKHRAPDVVIASGMTENGYVPVDSATLKTRFPDVYAVERRDDVLRAVRRRE